jgi:SAM-dependent methyltransferase
MTADVQAGQSYHLEYNSAPSQPVEEMDPRTGVHGFEGGQPIIKIRTIEQTKYEQMWEFDQYRQVAPGEDIAPIFLRQARPRPGSHVIDFGSGTGRGALMIAMLGRCYVHMLDFAENCLDEDVESAVQAQPLLDFTQHDLTKEVQIAAQYGYCTDVMEHIPPEQVDVVLRNVLRAAQHVFFQISTVDDVCGELIGQALHLSVHPYQWWLEKLQALDCVVHWSEETSNSALFYVTAWQSTKDFVKKGIINNSIQIIQDNVRRNLMLGLPELTPHETNNDEVIILGGGWSLDEYVDIIKRQRESGAKLVTLNNAYNWALQHGLTPSATFVVDSRPNNAKFVKPITDKTLYMIASQCDPSVLEGLPPERTYLWHTTMPEIKDIVNEVRERWYAIPGGSTVALRAIPALRMLGYRRFHCYGWDSCLRDSDRLAHAYDQPENNDDYVHPITCSSGRTFHCTTWMASQAQEFMDLIKFLGDEIELEVYGDGLLAHILKTGAEMFDAQNPIQLE